MLEEREDHLRRVRKICESFPETVEKLSHWRADFLSSQGRLCDVRQQSSSRRSRRDLVPCGAWTADGVSAEFPEVFFRPPYVGVKGWIGIELDRIDDDELGFYIREAWKLMEAKRKKPRRYT